MVTKTQTLPAGEFKARCLEVLDHVQRSRQTVIVTKRGKPVARVVPLQDASLTKDLRGSVLEEHDLVGPIDEAWDADR